MAEALKCIEVLQGPDLVTQRLHPLELESLQPKKFMGQRASVLALHTPWGCGHVRSMCGTGVDSCLCFYKPSYVGWSVYLSILLGTRLSVVLIVPPLANPRSINCAHLVEFECIITCQRGG